MLQKDRNLNIKFAYSYLLVFSILLGGFLRFYHIGGQPIWLDEAYSHWFSSRSILELWTIIPKFETNPPFYYTILKGWESLVGSSEVGLRSLSALMSLSCIPLIFMAGKLMGKSIEGCWVGAIAALLFAVSPVHIQYAQEARPYAMLTFATTMTLCSILWIIRHPSEACEPIFSNPFNPSQNLTNGNLSSKYIPWLTVIVAITLTLWLHNTSILYIFTLLIIIMTWLLFELKFNRTLFINIVGIALIVFLLWGPYLIFLIPQTGNASLPISKPTVLSTIDTVSWLLLGTSITWSTAIYKFKTFIGLLLEYSIPWNTPMMNEVLKLVAFGMLIMLASAGLLNIQRRSGKYVSLLILGSIVGPILMELIFSFAFRPIFLGRTLIYVSVPFFLAIAAGIMMFSDLRIRALIVILTSLLFLKWSYFYYADYHKEPWDKVAQIVTQQAGKSIVLLVPNNIELPISYYAEKMGNKNLQINPLPFPTVNFLYPSPGQERLCVDPIKALKMRMTDTPAIIKVIDQKSPVYLVTRREDLFDQEKIVFNILMQKRTLISTWNSEGINVFKFN